MSAVSGPAATATAAAADSTSSSSRRSQPNTNSPARAQSTRVRPTAVPPSPVRSTSSYTRPPSSGRAIEEVLPRRDQETSQVNQTARKRSIDRPSHSRTESARSASGRDHHRASSRSQHNQYAPPAAMDVSGGASNVNGSPSAAAPSHGAQRSGKSRTSIPAKTGTWILGKTIGAGSMGKVKLARRQEGGEQVRTI